MPDEFEGDPVTRSSVKITKAGDGLSDALKIDPVEFHRGDVVHFVLKGKVRYVAHPPAQKDSTDVVRQHIIDTIDIAIVDEARVAQLLEDNRERVKRALDSMKGQAKLGDPDPHTFDPDDEDETACVECGAGPDAPWHTEASK